MKKALIALAICSSLAIPAVAADNGMYAGISVTNTHLTNAGGTSLESTEFGGKIYGGYRYNQYLAAEASYSNLGSFSGNGLSLKGDTIGLGAVGFYPVATNLDLFGKVGLTRSSAKVDSASQSDESFRTGVTYSIGGEYKIDRRLGLRLEFERLPQIGDTDIHANVFSFGAGYKF